MSKIRDNPFYFIFLNLISSGVKQLPVSYGLILINFASFLVNTAQYILIIGSYLYTTYSNWSLGRLRHRVDDFMNTKGTSTISDVDLDSAIRLTQSQILSSLRESGHLTGHFVQGSYNEQSQLAPSVAIQNRDRLDLGTQTQQSSMTQQSQPYQVSQPVSQSRLFQRKPSQSQSRLDQSKNEINLSQSHERIQSRDFSQVIHRTPSKYVTEPRPHSSRSVIESSIDSICSERPGSISGHIRSHDQIQLKVSHSGDQIYEQKEPDDLISLKEVSTSSHSSARSTNDISLSDSNIQRKRHSSNQSNSSIPEQVRIEKSSVSPPFDAVSSATFPNGTDLSGTNCSGTNLSGTDRNGSNPSGTDRSGTDRSGTNLCGTNLSGTDRSGSDRSGTILCGTDRSGTNLSGMDRSGTIRSSTVRKIESSISETLGGKIIESAQKVFSSRRSSRRSSSVSTSTSNSDLHNKAFLEDPKNSSGSHLLQDSWPIKSVDFGPIVEMDSQRLTVIRGNEEQARQSLAAEMPRMTFMQQEELETVSEEENSRSSGCSFDPFASDDHPNASTNQNQAQSSEDPIRRFDVGDSYSQLEIIGGVKYLKNRFQMEKEALIKIKNEQALAKTRNDQIVDEAVCKIDSVKKNIRGNLDQIRNLIKP